MSRVTGGDQGHRHRSQARRVPIQRLLSALRDPTSFECSKANGNAIEQSRLYSVRRQKLGGTTDFFDEIVPLWLRSAPYKVQLTPIKYVHTLPVIHIRVVVRTYNQAERRRGYGQTHHHRVLRGLKLPTPCRRSGGRAGAEVRHPPGADQGRRRQLRRQAGRRVDLLEEAGRALSRPGRGRGDDRGADQPCRERRELARSRCLVARRVAEWPGRKAAWRS